MDTATTQDFTKVANTIRAQMGWQGLAVVGASDLCFTSGDHNLGALTFKARLHYKGQTRVRVARVTVSLSPLDYYDVRVTHTDKWGTVQREKVITDLDCFSLTSTMLDLDSKGF